MFNYKAFYQSKVLDIDAMTTYEAQLKAAEKMPDITTLMAFENGELDQDEVIDLFQDGVDKGWVWKLEGSYGRTAKELIELGYITEKQNA